MHMIAEIIIPPTDDILRDVTAVMDYFREEQYDEKGNELPEKGDAEWWDWFVIGGRFSGHKLECSLDPEKLKAFHEELVKRKVTVSGLQCGKSQLEPASQAKMVDKLWRETFPGRGDKCLLFAHSRNQYKTDGYEDDVCKVSEIPDNLMCSRLIVANWFEWKGKRELRPYRLLATEFYNRIEIQNTDFDGKVKPALERIRKGGCKNNPEYPQPVPVGDDWLVVTVDYHN